MSKKNKTAGVSIELIDTSKGTKLEISRHGTIRELLHKDHSPFAKSILALLSAISKK